MSIPSPADPPPPQTTFARMRDQVALIYSKCMENKKLVAGFLSGAGGPKLNELWFDIFPLPEALLFKGLLCAIAFSLVAMFVVKVVTDACLGMTQLRRRVCLIVLATTMAICSLIGFPATIQLLERHWKEGANEYIYRDLLEPAAYGMIFAAFAAFVALVLYLFVELFMTDLEKAPDG